MSKKKKKKKKIRKPVNWTEDDFKVKKSTIPKAGKGLFSKVKIRPGDCIGHYTGKVLTDAQANLEPYIDSLYLVWVCKDYWIWGEGPLSNYTRFINHDDKKPNAELVTSNRWKTARIVATRKIKRGEEVFFDYGEEYWEVVDIEMNKRPK